MTDEPNQTTDPAQGGPTAEGSASDEPDRAAEDAAPSSTAEDDTTAPVEAAAGEGSASDEPDRAAEEAAPSTTTAPSTTAAPSSTADATRRGARKVREGIVVSQRMDKTAVVAVTDRVRHPRYDKFILKTTKLYAHDESNDVNVGDRVRVTETRPLSKLKRWRISDILERAK